MLGIAGILVAIALLILLAYKGWGVLPITIIATFVVIVTNGLGIWDAFSGTYMKGYVGGFTSYFLMFSCSALYAKIMNDSGSAVAVGYKLSDWFGKKNALLVSIIVVSFLTYGGISAFVVIFAVAPIIFTLFKEANLPRHLTAAVMALGAGTYTMYAVPGTPATQNLIPSEFLGTKLTAAPVLTMIALAMMLVGGLGYVKYAEKKALAKGEVWSYPANMDASKWEVSRDDLPAAWKAFLPICVLIIFILVGGQFISNVILLTCEAMLIGSVLAFVLNFNKMKSLNIKELITTGLTDGLGPTAGLAAVLGFGAVVSSTEAYQNILNMLFEMNASDYVKGTIATAVIAGVTGSASGGSRLMLTSMGEYFLSSGCDLEILHRLVAIASGTLDSLPHNSAIFVILGGLGLSHKEGYRHYLWLTVILPAVVLVILTAVCTFIA